MEEKETKKMTSTLSYVLWILLAIIGVGLLFTGMQNSVAGGNITVSVMSIVIGIILTTIGLLFVIGRANIEAPEIKSSKKK